MSDAKILIVEDEGLTAMELQQKLLFWGYDVPTFAFSKRDAVKKAEETKPDLVLMDIVLKGGGDGIEAAKEIIERFNIPVIYVTAYGDEKTLQRAKMTKPSAYILKPYEDTELQNNIEMALYKHKIEQKLEGSGKWLDKELEGLGGAVIVTDADGSINFMNSVAESLTGWKQKDALVKDLVELFGIGTEKTSKKTLKEVLKERRDVGLKKNAVLKSKDGREIFIEYNIAPIRDDKGDVIGASLIFHDISKREKKRVPSLKSEKWFKNIYEQSSIGIGVYNVDGQLIDANKAFSGLFGASDISELKRFNLFEDFKLPHNEKERLLHGQTIKYGTKFDFEKVKELELYNTTKSGIVHFELSIIPLFLEGDEPLSVYLIQVQDITKRKMLEEALWESKSNYEELLENIEDVFFAIDKDLRCIYWNKASEDLTGIQPKDAIGKSLYELFPGFKGTEVEGLYLKVLETQSHQSIVKEYRKNDDKSFLEINAYPSRRGVSVFIKDISGIKFVEEILKKSEKLYRTVVSDQTDLICRFDPDGILTFANEAYCNYFGKEVVGNSFYDFIPDKDHENMRRCMASFAPKNPAKRIESRALKPDGSIKWFEWAIKAIFNNEGNIVEFQFVGRDITEHKQEEEALKKEHQELEGKSKADKEALKAEIAQLKHAKESFTKEHQELERKADELTRDKKSLEAEINVLKQIEEQIKESLVEKEMLLGEIHHRVKRSMQSFSSLVGLQSGYLRDQIIEKLKDSQNHIKSIALVHEKLYESKDLKRIDFSEYIQNLTNDLFRSYGVDQNLIKLKINIDDVSLDIDTTIRLGLIINELVSNSLKYAFPDDRKGEIQIDFHSDDGKFTLKVSDNGIGFPKDLDFQKTETLGLQLVGTLVRQLDGTIELDRITTTEFKITFAKPIKNTNE